MKDSWFARFFSDKFSESSKRLCMVVLVMVFIIQFFVLIPLKVPVANKELVAQNIRYLVILILVFGTYITSELITKFFTRKAELQAGVDTTKANAGVPDTIVQQDVNTQNVVADSKTVVSKEKV